MSNRMLGLAGQRIRSLREQKAWTRADLCEKAGVSPRFLADLEKGDANVSLLRLSEIAEALSVSLVSLLAGSGPVRDEAEVLVTLSPSRRKKALLAASAPEKLALVGLRGAGKTTVGQLLAQRLGVPFVEVDAAVEERAGMHLGEIFEFHGAVRYRELERQALEAVLARPGGAVLATGGSVVTAAESWALLRASAYTIWLKTTPEIHLSRVEAQGDFRPMRGRADALSELKELLQRREPLYAQCGMVVETTGKMVEEVVKLLVLEATRQAA